MLSHPIILEWYEIFSTWIKAAVCEVILSPPSVDKLKRAWNFISVLSSVFECDAQFLTQKS